MSSFADCVLYTRVEIKEIELNGQQYLRGFLFFYVILKNIVIQNFPLKKKEMLFKCPLLRDVEKLKRLNQIFTCVFSHKPIFVFRLCDFQQNRLQLEGSFLLFQTRKIYLNSYVLHN